MKSGPILGQKGPKSFIRRVVPPITRLSSGFKSGKLIASLKDSPHICTQSLRRTFLNFKKNFRLASKPDFQPNGKLKFPCLSKLWVEFALKTKLSFILGNIFWHLLKESLGMVRSSSKI